MLTPDFRADRLARRLTELGIPAHGCSHHGGGQYSVQYKDEATNEQKQQGDAIAATYDPTPADMATWEQQLRRQQAKELLDDPGPEGILRRAIARAFGSLLNPAKTLAQLRAIMDADIDTGACD